MPLTIEDLKPKPVKIKLGGVELESKPLRLSHGLVVAKIGNVFQNTDKATREEIKQAEADMDEVIGDLIPELRGIELDMSTTMELIEQLMGSIEPADDKQLKDKGVKFDSDPKV